MLLNIWGTPMSMHMISGQVNLLLETLFPIAEAITKVGFGQREVSTSFPPSILGRPWNGIRELKSQLDIFLKQYTLFVAESILN